MTALAAWCAAKSERAAVLVSTMAPGESAAAVTGGGGGADRTTLAHGLVPAIERTVQTNARNSCWPEVVRGFLFSHAVGQGSAALRPLACRLETSAPEGEAGRKARLAKRRRGPRLCKGPGVCGARESCVAGNVVGERRQCATSKQGRAGFQNWLPAVGRGQPPGLLALPPTGGQLWEEGWGSAQAAGVIARLAMLNSQATMQGVFSPEYAHSCRQLSSSCHAGAPPQPAGGSPPAPRHFLRTQGLLQTLPLRPTTFLLHQ